MDVKGGMALAAEQMKDAMEAVKETLGTQQQKKKEPLSKKQQLALFFAMNAAEFQALRQRVGNDAFNAYFQEMKKLSKEL